MFETYFLAGKCEIILIILGISASVAESLADPAATIVIGFIFKEVQKIVGGELAPGEFLHQVQKYTFCLLAITAYSAFTGMLSYMIWVHLGYNIGHKARSKLYKALVQKPTAWFDDRSNLSGRAMMHYKDIQDLETAAGITSCEIVSMFSGCIVEICVAFYFSWAVTLICLAGVPILVLTGAVFSKPITDKISSSKSLQDTISEKSNWVLRALQTVKIFQRESFEWKSVNVQLAKLQKIKIGYWLLFNLQEGICRSIVLLVFMQGFYFGSFMVRKHGLNAGNVVTVFWACLNASALLQALIGHLIEWNKGQSSAERLIKALYYNKEEELYNSIGLAPEEPSKLTKRLESLGWNMDDCAMSVYSDDSSSLDILGSFYSHKHTHSISKVPLKGHITLSDVVFSYPSRPEIVFSDLNMEFKAGETTFIIGPSGSGKSSLAGLLSKQYPCQAGEISIDSHDVHLLSKQWIEKNIYVCEQNPKIFDISVKENIKIGSFFPEQVSNEDIEKALQDSCAQFVYDLPEKANTMGATQLSGGQVQRINLARARIRNAPIMLFDEVTSALDQELQNKVFKHLLNYRKGKTTIIITHSLTVIPEGYPVYVIEDGHAVRYRTIADIHPDNGLNINIKPSKDTNQRLNEHWDSRSDHESSLSIEASPEQKAENQPSDISEILVNFELFKSIPNKPLYFLGLFLTAIHAAINPVFSFVFSKLVMGIIEPKAKGTTLWAMLVLMCAILDGVITFAKGVINISGEKWLSSIRMSLYDKLLNFPGSKLSDKQVSYYSKLLMSDIEKCAEILTKYLPGLLSMIILGLVGFIWALVIGWKLTLVGSSVLPVFILFNQLYKRMYTYWTQRREQLRSSVIRLMMDLTSEQGFRTLKVQHLEKYFKEFYCRREYELHKISIPMIYQIGLGYGLLKCFPYALETLLLWYGMRLIGNGSYEASKTITVFSMLIFTIVTIDQLTSVIGSVGTGFEALQRLVRVIKGRDFDLEPPKCLVRANLSDIPPPKWKSLTFYRIGVTHHDGSTVLGNFSAQINEGECVALTGPSGIGKSTIARLLERLEQPTTGEIIVDASYDLLTLSHFETRQNVALVGQAPLDFFDGTIEENLLYGIDDNDLSGSAKMVDICIYCGAHNFICDLKEGYDTRIKSGLLSGGQMQRIGIARALLRKPKILILDECTSALDTESRAAVKAMINNLKCKREMMIIIITHQLDVANIADRIIDLNEL